MPMGAAQPRTSDIRIWLVTVLFFSCIVVGGAFLVLYVFLPDTSETSWYPVIGMILVGIPWLFWLVTYLYRVLWKRWLGGGRWYPSAGAGANGGHDNNNSTAAITIDDGGLPETPGSSDKRVRFGGATVLDSVEEGEEGEDSSENRGQAGSGAGNSAMTTASEASSHASRECEVPLAFAMSS